MSSVNDGAGRWHRLGSLAVVSAVMLSASTLAGDARGAIVGPFSAAVDFHAAADLADFTVQSSGGSTINFSTATGPDGTSGRINFTPDGTSDSLIYYTPAAASGGQIQLQGTADSATISWDFLVTNGSSDFVPRIGFRSQVSSGDGPSVNAYEIYTLPRLRTTLSLRNLENGSPTNNVNDTNTFSLSENAWYRMELSLTRNAAAGEFAVASKMFSLTGAAINQTLGSFSQTFTNSTLSDDGFYAYFDFQSNSDTNQFSTAADNFAVVVVPEPSLAAAFALAVPWLLLRRRRSRAG